MPKMLVIIFWGLMLPSTAAYARGASYSEDFNIGSVLFFAAVAFIVFKAFQFIGKMVLNSEIHRKEDLYIAGFVVFATVLVIGKYLINLIFG